MADRKGIEIACVSVIQRWRMRRNLRKLEQSAYDAADAAMRMARAVDPNWDRVMVTPEIQAAARAATVEIERRNAAQADAIAGSIAQQLAAINIFVDPSDG